MKTYKISTVPGAKMISLCHLLDEMVVRTRKNHRNFIINDVPRRLTIEAEKNMLDPILGELLTMNPPNPTCVRISARKSDNEVMIYIKRSEIRGLCLSGIRVNAA